MSAQHKSRGQRGNERAADILRRCDELANENAALRASLASAQQREAELEAALRRIAYRNYRAFDDPSKAEENLANVIQEAAAALGKE